MNAEHDEELDRRASTTGRGAGSIESAYMSAPQVQAFLRLVESAPEVNSRARFYLWMQSHVCVLLPHDVAVCGSYCRQKRQVEFEVFNTIVLPPSLVDALSGVDSDPMAQVSRHWVAQGGRARNWQLEEPASEGDAVAGRAFLAAGLSQFAVHGVARPGRPHEIETLFLLCARAGSTLAASLPAFELLVPHLHATYLRARNVERDLARHSQRPVAPAEPDRRTERVTPREAQILTWVRDGKSNHEIGAVLGISGLTVKNHVQKILRKLGAVNRAQAVAIAIELRLISVAGVPPPSHLDGMK